MAKQLAQREPDPHVKSHHLIAVRGRVGGHVRPCVDRTSNAAHHVVDALHDSRHSRSTCAPFISLLLRMNFAFCLMVGLVAFSSCL